jgi:hypothetical protein
MPSKIEVPMSFLRNLQIEKLTKKATDYVLAQLVDYLKFSEQVTEKGKERETENEALQILFYIFMKKNNILHKAKPQDKAYLTLILYVTELVNLEIPLFWGNTEDVQLIGKTAISHLQKVKSHLYNEL